MICFMCRGTLEDGFSNFTTNLDKRVVVVKNVPSRVCDQCGTASYDNETARRLEEIVRSLAQPANTKIAVVSYTEKAA